MHNTPKFIVASDGTSLAYWKRGGAPLALVYTNGYATSDFYWTEVLRRFEGRATQITWDLKGHGRSGPAHDLDHCTIQDSVDDLRRVLDAANIDKAVFFGFSLGCQIILEAWRQMPERISALVPVLGTYERPFDNFLHPALGAVAFEAFQRIGPPLAHQWMDLMHKSMTSPLSHTANQITGMVGRKVSRARMLPFYEHFKDLDGPTWASMGLAAQQHSAKDVLASIDVPTLIVAGGRDVFTPERMSMYMEQTIPGARLLYLPNATHAGLMEEPELIGVAIEKFLYDHNFM